MITVPFFPTSPGVTMHVRKTIGVSAKPGELLILSATTLPSTSGHADVQEDQVGLKLPRDIERLGGIVEFPNFITARSLQDQPGDTGGVAIVINNQYAAYFHGCFPSMENSSTFHLVLRLFSIQLIMRGNRAGLATK